MEHWRDDAACVEAFPEQFFPEGEPLDEVNEVAFTFCLRCSVLTYCHMAGLGEQHGIWAGMGSEDRLRRRSQLGIRLLSFPSNVDYPNDTHAAAQHAYKHDSDPVDALVQYTGMEVGQAKGWMGLE